MTKHIINNPFRVERLRFQRAVNNDSSGFLELYTKKYEEIENRNSGSMWDSKNSYDECKLTSSEIFKDKLKTVINFLSKRQGRLLDVGFGSGILLRRLSGGKIKLYGIDISSKSVSKINRVLDGIFKVGNISNIPFKESYFDFVTALDVLEHISPTETFQSLKEINRVLKSKGYMLASVPLNEGLEDMLRKGENPNAHVRVYRPEVLKKELEIAGFQVVGESLLYAFRRFYALKKYLLKLLPFGFREPNLYIVFAQKVT